MLASDIQNATNHELMAALANDDLARLKPEILAEADRRLKKRTIEKTESSPFNPHRDISADAKYVWKRIFIWFWAIPAAASVAWFLVVTLK